MRNGEAARGGGLVATRAFVVSTDRVKAEEVSIILNSVPFQVTLKESALGAFWTDDNGLVSLLSDFFVVIVLVGSDATMFASRASGRSAREIADSFYRFLHENSNVKEV